MQDCCIPVLQPIEIIFMLAHPCTTSIGLKKVLKAVIGISLPVLPLVPVATFLFQTFLLCIPVVFTRFRIKPQKLPSEALSLQILIKKVLIQPMCILVHGFVLVMPLYLISASSLPV